MPSETTDPALAVIIGGGGGIGSALADGLERSGNWQDVWRTTRAGKNRVDLLEEETIADLARRIRAGSLPLRLVLVASGFLHDARYRPEKTWRHLDPEHMAKAFAINAIGPALVMKHLLPLLPSSGQAVFAALSARVGSIGDNRLGGWTSYRASKAALNQIIRTHSIELQRRNPDAICVALHPGTVATSLSAPFAARGLKVRSPETAATEVLSVIDRLTPAENGAFLDQNSKSVPW
ncbi:MULTISPECIES: SDR family NAD(P)-dependent oxidoreductase [unclassified Minwuia]|jgi:NAD(P)-dependent dehydrogenase (short-subunit alcohol dehydrogenase family)|uniref:SDR family NAD(P)-dependent oxidoreductase n=1 Tax=unclassified Minwuia TaxID=2618799 RepID=UPI00247A7C5D|nr:MULTISPECIES: SDR family NAD(P)-dependent oxidoreductase [unclassified Minwuia]